MAARSAMTVTTATTITSTWGNNVRDHIVPKTTSDDVSSEGQLAVNTTSDRIMAHDGSSAVRIGHYSVGGRTCCIGTGSSGSIGSGSTAELNFTMSSDGDSMYTGWNGSHYVFTIPAGLGGIWAITFDGHSGTGMSGGGSMAATIAGTIYAGYAPVNGSHMMVTAVVPMSAGNTFYVNFYNGHSSSVTATWGVTATRLCI
jgi:hypothetical protein